MVNKLVDGKGFNPRPRTGGDISDPVYYYANHHVSIHAPARGATGNFEELRPVVDVSIHAPARGATF